jgi:hypothetical protein
MGEKRSIASENRYRTTAPIAVEFSGKWTAPMCPDIGATQDIHSPFLHSLKANLKRSKKRCGYL